MVKRSFGTLLRPLRNGPVVEGACGDARAALLIDRAGGLRMACRGQMCGGMLLLMYQQCF